jgi:hypothetical protein
MRVHPSQPYVCSEQQTDMTDRDPPGQFRIVYECVEAVSAVYAVLFPLQ